MTEKNKKKIFTVSKLTREIKTLLEEKYPFIWITGEISNYTVPSSGHSYFTLKDDRAVIQSVMFKNQKRGLKFVPEHGMKVFGLARLTLYEPRGNYQLIFEHLEPDGVGSAQIAFEQLKTRLAEKGLFNDEHKKPIPFLPTKLVLITSGTGAALKDILNVLERRFSSILIDIIPVKVQGLSASQEICTAFHTAQTICKPDLIILARGGGSLEDLAPFNDEKLAMTMFECDVPIITGIGHETDFTIADFVADLRAPTPSAAAELAVPDQNALFEKLDAMVQRLDSAVDSMVEEKQSKINELASRIKSPQVLVYNHALRLEELRERLDNSVKQNIYMNSMRSRVLLEHLYRKLPLHRISHLKSQVEHCKTQLTHGINAFLNNNRNNLTSVVSQLEALNPVEILNRGYSITRDPETGRIITTYTDAEPDDEIEVILSQGHLTAKVKQTYGQEKDI